VIVSNKIYRKDCVEGLKQLADESVAMVFADPPYNLSGSSLVNRKSRTGGDFQKVNEAWDNMPKDEYMDFTFEWISSVHRILKSNGAIYICASYHNLEQALAGLRYSGFIVKNILTWEKPNAMPNLTRRTFTHSTEFIVWAVKGKGWVFNFDELKKVNPDRQADGSPKMLRDVWRLPVVQGQERLRGIDGKALHPTQKPLELVKRCILASSQKYDLVVDPFSGSGTTAAASLLLDRSFIGFELEEKYFEASKVRLRSLRRELRTSKS